MAWSLLKIEVAECPECLCKIPFHKKAQLGQIVYCPECCGRFEVCRLEPLELDWAEDEYEDYFDDDYEEWA